VKTWFQAFDFKSSSRRYASGRIVGLVIDLSNHDCLYLDGVPPHLERVHVRNVAKSIPNIECTSEVIAVADEFWSRKPEQYIAIHCAYGFNRTGFVLCCYLIEQCGLSADEALANFAEARSPVRRPALFFALFSSFLSNYFHVLASLRSSLPRVRGRLERWLLI
jgi:protein-tyrosine phosphatase